MFVHPATTHIPRTYHPPTTARRRLAVHNENDLTSASHGLPSKTPSRAGPSGVGAKVQMGPGTNARIGLGAKTEGRDRNVLARQVGGGGKGKGKGKEEEIEPKRLFTSSSALPPSKSLSNLPLISRQQPAKTPARTRKPPPNTLRTPAPSTFKIAPDPSSTPLPSATRRRRSRTSGGGGGANGGIGATPVRPTVNQFQTPLPSGEQWEEENSLEEVQEVQQGIELDILGEVEEESEPDVEYMPPRAVELPFQPEWGEDADIPNLVRRLQGVPPVMFSGELKEVPEFVMQEEEPVMLNLASDEDLEDPLFRRPAPFQLKSTDNNSIKAVPAQRVPDAARTTIQAGPKMLNQAKKLQPPRPTMKPSATTASRNTTSTNIQKPIPTKPSAKGSTIIRPSAPKTNAIRRQVLSARPANPNLPPAPQKPIGNGQGKKGGKLTEQEKEDEGLRLAAMELGGMEVVLDLDFGLDEE